MRDRAIADVTKRVVTKHSETNLFPARLAGCEIALDDDRSVAPDAVSVLRCKCQLDEGADIIETAPFVPFSPVVAFAASHRCYMPVGFVPPELYDEVCRTLQRLPR